jgi:hypothetical protein
MATAHHLEQHRAALTGHCYRMLGSAGFEVLGWSAAELSGDRIAAMNSFLDTEALFPRLGGDVDEPGGDPEVK